MGNPTKSRVILYRAKCRSTGKSYFGVTERTINCRKREHISAAMTFRGKHPFSRAIRKHGPDQFDWEIVQTFMFAEDALKAEMSAIRTCGKSQTYNMTEGGPGCSGRPMSAEGRQRLSEFHRGKKWHLGHRHSDDTKNLLRRLGIRNRASWMQHSHLGPEASAKPVVCLNDGYVFQSASAAARFYGASKSLIIEVCNRNPRRATAKGRVFRYEGDHSGGEEEFNSQMNRVASKSERVCKKLQKAVKCLTDGLVFESPRIASEHYGCHRMSICEVARGDKKSIRGLKFVYVSDI